MEPAFKKDVVVYYLFSFFIGFYIANGTTVLFARELDLSFSQIFILGAFYMLMFVLFEIPSGALADLIGRRQTLMAGGFVLALAAVASGLSSTFLQLFLSFFIWALGFSLISGANEALLYDRLADEKLYSSVLGRSFFFFLGGTALAGVVGPQLFVLNFRYPYLFSAIPFLLAGAAIAFFRESRAAREFSLGSHWRQVKTGLVLAYGSRPVLWAIAIMSLSFGAAYTFSNAYQPYLQNIGFPVKVFSILLPIMFLAEALGSSSFGRVFARFSENQIFTVSLLGIAAGLAFLGLFPVREGFGILLGYAFLQGILRPAISTYSNRHITASHRATVISVQGMVATTTAALMLFLFGFLTDRIGLNSLLAVLGALVLLFSGILLLVKPKKPAT